MICTVLTFREARAINSIYTRKQKILIVDDSEINRSILADMLGEEYEIIEAEDGVQAVSILQKQAAEISLVLLDMAMPRMDGFEVLKVMAQNYWTEDIPIIMISAESGSAYVQRAYEMGVTDFIARPFDALIVHRRVVNTLLLYSKQKRLMELVEEQMDEKERYSHLMIDILSHVVEFRNGESGLHVLHVHTMTELLLNRLVEKTDRYQLSQSDISLIGTASALHDIGKIAIDESILNKPGRLSNEEFERMKAHAALGEKILKDIPFHREEPLLKIACEICRWHHERYDGRGYPDGLSGDDIPISAQIVALADVYDALTSKRVYKDAYSHEKAIEMILDGQCGSFDPLLLECLRDIADGLKDGLENAVRLRTARRETRGLTQEVLRGKRAVASERSLRLLDRERMKYNFFADMSEEIQFEYTASPPLLTLSRWGAKKLGLHEVIAHPQEDEQLHAVLGEEVWEQISGVLRGTAPKQPITSCECDLCHNGQLRRHRIIAQAIWTEGDDPEYLGAIGKAVDIHEDWLRLEELKEKASHDMLTGLLNLSYAKEQIMDRLRQDPEGSFSLAICDLDKFKSANDVYGHDFGNRVLKHVAEKLCHNTRGDDVVARIGGDEFMLFLHCGENIEAVIQRIFTSMLGTYEGFPISMSMGIVRTADVGMDFDTLFHAADQALYSAKRSGRGRCCFYNESMRDMLSAISPIGDQETGSADPI